MTQTTRLLTLQVFRGVAALLVVLYHTSVYSRDQLGYSFAGGLFLFGHTGVDIFFVLSGFIIYYIHHKDIGQKDRVKDFAAKRLARVIPIYWIVTGIKLLALLSVPAIGEAYERDFGVIIKSLLLIPQPNGPIINAAWTLSNELLFYLLFGFAILLGNAWAIRLFLAWGALIVAYISVKLIGVRLPDIWLIQFVLNERNLEFCFGCFSAYLVMSLHVPAAALVALLGLLLFGIAAASVAGGYIPQLYSPIFGVASFLVVTGSAAYELRRQLAVPRLFVFIGDASYSIYLTHVMFISGVLLLYRRFNIPLLLGPLVSALSVIIFAVGLGCLFCLTIERPILRRLATRPRQKLKPEMSPS
jgi:exopolysaccharide production protein ExoZ